MGFISTMTQFPIELAKIKSRALVSWLFFLKKKSQKKSISFLLCW
jgi:hypothetical protein